MSSAYSSTAPARTSYDLARRDGEHLLALAVGCGWMTRLYLLAGEPSGDRLGGALMQGLRKLGEPQFRGVGGRSMAAQGLASRFDMAELTVMGLTEVLPRLPQLIARIRETAEDVVRWRPDALVTIDSPDFTLRVAARARAQLPNLRVIHYVAPSVWAWRPGRAAKMARHVDHVLALLPFEPPYMEAAGMTCDFVGHPVASRPQPTAEETAAFRSAHGLGPYQPVLLIAPGSRAGELRRLVPDFATAARRLVGRHPDLALLVPVAETVSEEARAAFAGIATQTVLVDGADETAKLIAFAAADAALCASGTVVLELAAADTPMVAAYRTTWLTAQIARRLIRVDTANLVNLVAGRRVVPEFLQEFCDPDVLVDALDPLLSGEGSAADQRAAFVEVMKTLGRGGEPPGLRAARSVLAAVKRS